MRGAERRVWLKGRKGNNLSSALSAELFFNIILTSGIFFFKIHNHIEPRIQG
jgi:hypothetical protein